MIAADAQRPSVYAVATMDTKGDEILFVAEHIRAAGADVKVINVGTLGSHEQGAHVGRREVAAHHPIGKDAVLNESDRGRAIAAMSKALTVFVSEECAAGRLSAIIGIGGGGGTSLITRAMRALPLGVPKLMVSTLASGNVEQYVDCSDITMMPAVVDVAGINRLSAQILSNAAYAIAGMALSRAQRARPDDAVDNKTVAMTMFGVTTPCVEVVRKTLAAQGHDCLVFHATGTGGRTMEKLVESGFIDAVLDITTTEVADEVVGGVLSAGPKRFECILARRIPYVMSLGALDMVNFAGLHTVPERFRQRKLHVHNSEVTLMRTTADENRAIARWIAARMNRATSPVVILIPERGVSALDAPGQPFHDSQADAALFEELEKTLCQDNLRHIRRLPLHINDPAFALALVDAYKQYARFEP